MKRSYLHKRKTKDGVFSWSQKLKFFMFFLKGSATCSHKQQYPVILQNFHNGTKK